MLTVADFQLASCQATLLTPEAEVSVARLFTRLVPRWITRFDAESTVLATAQGLPRELPRVIFQSRSGEWRCEVASARINVFWGRSSPEGEGVQLAEFYREVTPMLHEYCDFLDSRVGRLAAVINRYVLNPAPARFLASHFCKQRWLAGPLNRPASFELHAHKTFLLAGRFQINSWVRNKTGTVGHPGQESPVVLVEQDFNTLAEEAEKRRFSTEEIAAFFEVAVPGFDETLNLYYPSAEET